MFFWAIDILAEIVFWSGVMVLGWYAYILLFNRGIPNIRTPHEMQDAMIEALRRDMQSKVAASGAAGSGGGAYKVVDLGSGNGEFTRRIARRLPEAQVYGVEISWKSYLWACFMRRLCGLKNLHYARGDIFDADVSGMDATVFYLASYVMERMGQKLAREMKEGAMVVSHRFFLGGGWLIAQTHEVETLYAFERHFYVYYKTAAGVGLYQPEILRGLQVDADIRFL